MLPAIGVICLALLVFSVMLKATIAEPVLDVIGAGTILLFLLLGRGLPSSRETYRVDSAILLVVLTEFVLVATSIYPRNSFEYLPHLISCIVAYLLFRVVDSKWNAQRWLIIISASIGGIIVLFTSLRYIRWAYSAQALGFFDLSSLKAIAPRAGGILPNTWATILLALLPFSFAGTALAINCNRYFVKYLSMAGNVIIIVGILLTLSRGGYLGFAVFLSVLAVIFLRLKLKVPNLAFALVMALFISVLLVFLFVPSSRGEAWQIFARSSLSEVRSVDGRFMVWKRCAILIRNHPLLGVGGNNFALTYNALPDKDDNFLFVGQPFNLFLSILIERGILGLIVYSTLFICFLRAAMTRLNDGVTEGAIAAIFITAGIIALIVRDLTFSSLLSSPQVMILLWLLLAIVVSQKQRCDPHIFADVKQRRLISIGGMAAFFGVLIISGVATRYALAKRDYRIAGRKLHGTTNFIAAIAALDSAIKKDPHNAQYYAARGLVTMLSQGTLNQVAIASLSPPGPGEDAGLSIGSAIADYNKALQIIPTDDNFQYNLGRLYWYQGDLQNYALYLDKALQMNKSEPVYHILEGSLLDERNERASADEEYSQALLMEPEITGSEWFRDMEQNDSTRSSELLHKSIDKCSVILSKKFDPIVLAKRGSLLVHAGQPQDAIRDLTIVVAQLQQMPLPWINLARALRFSGRQDQAKAAYRRAIFLNPQNIYARSELASIFLSEGKSDQAVKLRRNIKRSLAEPRITQHASRTERLYLLPPIWNDDLLPSGLLALYRPTTESQEMDVTPSP